MTGRGGKPRTRSTVTFHTFRHTCASLLFDAGRNVKQVQEWLGHADPSFTLRTYVHLIDDRMGGADFLDDAVSVAEPESAHAVAHAKASTSCGPSKGKTLLAGRKVRVYSLPDPKFPESECVSACLVGMGRTWRLDRGPKRVPFGGGWPGVDTDVLAVHAPWVAYPERFSGLDTWVLTVAAKNLRTGATSYCFVGGVRAPGHGPSVTGIALRGNGHRAWIGETAARWHEVAACPSAELEAESVEIERGGGIDLHSLSLRGSMLTWKASGETHSAILR